MKCSDLDIPAPTTCQMTSTWTSAINSYFQMKCAESDIPPNTSDEVYTDIRYQFIFSDEVFTFRYTPQVKCTQISDINLYFKMKCTDLDILMII